MVLFLVPLAATLLWRAMSAGWRAGGRRRTRVVRWTIGSLLIALMCVVASILVVFRMFHVGTRPIGDHLNGPQATAIQAIGDGLWQVLTQSALVGLGTDVTGPVWLLAIIVFIGLFIAMRSPRLRWLAIAYTAAALLFALAAGSNDDLTKVLTGLWYKDRYRLSALLPMAAAPLAAIGLAAGCRRLTGSTASVQRLAPARLTAIAAALLTAASAWMTMWGPVGTATSHEYRLEQSKTVDFVDATEAAFLSRVSEIVPADELVLGDPWDGSALVWMYGEREPVFPHLNGQWDPDRLLLAEHLPEINTNPDVCTALDRLNVHYVLYNPVLFDGGDPSGDKFAGVHAAAEDGLFAEVARSGDTVLYRIDQCG